MSMVSRKAGTGSPRRIAKQAAAWAVRKYGTANAAYFINHTHEVTEGFLSERYPELTYDEIYGPEGILALAVELVQPTRRKKS